MKEVKILKNNGIIVMRTDTVYGLFTAFDNEHGLKRIIQLKGRDPEKPFQVFISSFSDLEKLGVDKVCCLEKILPGPFTVVCPTDLRKKFIVKDQKIGIRYTKIKKIEQLIKILGKPLASTSLNINAAELKKKQTKNKYKDIFFSDPLVEEKGSKPSTVIEIVQGGYNVLRFGKGNMKKLNADLMIGSDHAGFTFKKEVEKVLARLKKIYLDIGPFKDDPVDYPDYAKIVAKNVQKNYVPYGVLICGSGIGMSIAANRFKGVRAALVSDPELSILARKHNNANVLVLPGRFLDVKLMEPIIKNFFVTDFDGGRHSKRIEKIEKD